jgi:hypothetical protein
MILAMVVPYLFIKVIERIHDGENVSLYKVLISLCCGIIMFTIMSVITNGSTLLK